VVVKYLPSPEFVFFFFLGGGGGGEKRKKKKNKKKKKKKKKKEKEQITKLRKMARKYPNTSYLNKPMFQQIYIQL